MRPYHVKVGERANGRPEDGAGLDRLDPHGIGEEHAEDGDTLVIVGAGHRTRDVARHDRDHGSCY